MASGGGAVVATSSSEADDNKARLSAALPRDVSPSSTKPTGFAVGRGRKQELTHGRSPWA